MDAERLGIARRLVACPKWVWSPGMLCYGRLHTSALKTVEVTAPMRIASVSDAGVFVETSIFTRGGRVVRTLALFEPSIPDLDDELTRTGGLLSVVRRALVSADVWIAPKLTPEPRERGWLVFGVAIVVGEGQTEEAAQLAALESAPHG